jgi:hypothetical protein
MPERLRIRSGDDEALAWSNAFRQSSHAETLVKIIVCGDGLILRIGDLRASCDFCDLRLLQDPRFCTARRAQIERSAAMRHWRFPGSRDGLTLRGRNKNFLGRKPVWLFCYAWLPIVCHQALN